MPTNQELAKAIDELLAADPQINLVPDFSIFPESYRAQILEEDTVVMQVFTEFYRRAKENPDGTNIAKLIEPLLILRWAYIKNSDIDYIHCPGSRSNKICTRLAETIAGEHTPIVQLLMPTLVQRDYLAGSLQDLTEKEIDGKRRLMIDNTYLLMEDEKTLLTLPDWLEYQNDPASPYLFHLYHVEGETPRLTEDDLKQLQTPRTVDLHSFFGQINYYRELRRSNATLYGVFSKLCATLKAGGESVLDGNVDEATRNQRTRVAGPEADKGVKDFFELWGKLPDTEEKKNLLNLRSKAFDALMQANYGSYANYQKYHPSIDEYLAVLRHGAGLQSSSREQELCKNVTFIHCVEVISKGINEILQAHPSAFEVATPLGETQQVKKTFAKSFAEVKQALKNELDQKKHENIKAAPEKITDVIVRFFHYQQSYRRFLLQILNTDPHFLAYSKEDLTFILSSLSPDKASKILADLPENELNNFFAYICNDEFHLLIAAVIRAGANIGTELPELEQDLLSCAILNDWNDTIEVLLEKNLTLLHNAWHEGNRTPLHIALELGQIGLAKKILLNLKQHLNREALLNIAYLVDEDDHSIVDLILNNYGLDELEMLFQIFGSDVLYFMSVDDEPPIQRMARINDIVRMKIILEWTQGDLLEIPNGDELTLLHLIAVNNYNEPLNCLTAYLGKGNKWDALVFVKNPLDQTPFHVAAATGHAGIVTKMLDFTSVSKIESLILDSNLVGDSSIISAMKNNHMDIAICLLETLTKNNLNDTAAYHQAYGFAVQIKNPTMILRVIQSDQTNKINNEELNKGLGWAMEMDNPELALAFIKKGATLKVEEEVSSSSGSLHKKRRIS